MSSDSGAAPPGSSTINLDQMSLDQLNQLKQQEEARMQAFTNRFAQFRSAHARLANSQAAVSNLTPASEGKTVLVPLTESVYVPGKIREPTKCLVDVGTGFYVEKSNKETNEFLDRKLKIVDANSENMTKAIQATKQNLDAVSIAMQSKMLEIRARQDGQRFRAAAEGQS